MLDGECDDLKQTMGNEVRKEVRTSWSLEVLCNGRALVQEMYSVLLALCVRVLGVKDSE